MLCDGRAVAMAKYPFCCREFAQGAGDQRFTFAS